MVQRRQWAVRMRVGFGMKPAFAGVPSAMGWLTALCTQQQHPLRAGRTAAARFP